MTYPELKIALDMGDPEDVLLNLNPSCYYGKYFIVCDDGDIHYFDRDGKEHKIDYIPYYCFASQFFKKIIIPKTVTRIEDHAFFDCNRLTNVIIPDNVTEIWYDAFYGCNSLTDVTIGSGLTSIGYRTFCVCSNLRNVTISSNIKQIGGSAFRRCYRLKQVLFKGKTMEQIKAMEGYPWGIRTPSVIQAGLQ